MQPRNTRRHCTGFTILEMSVVLVVIALIIGAVSVGRDVYRSAVAERIGSDFVQGWIIAYDRYVAQVGAVPGDNLSNPSGRVNNSMDLPLCDESGALNLRNAMLSRGIALPQGRAEGMESRYVYQDSNGSPRELRVCFMNVGNWAEPSSGSGYVGRSRNVMRLEGLTPELAQQIDIRIDGRIDARFGRFRERNQHSNTSPMPSTPASALDNPWSDLEFDPNVSNSDQPVPSLVGYLKMTR